MNINLIILVLAVLVAMLVVMAGGWAYQRAVRNGGWTDVFWTYGTGATCALASLAPFGGSHLPTWRQMMVAALVAIWALRLGTYVMLRVASHPEDARYREFRRAWGADFQRRMFSFLLTQAPATAVLSVSILLAARNPAPGLRLADIVGAGLLVVAIAGEGLADRQMQRFKALPHAPDAICEVGLWGWSRHPNYFFEWLGWLAYPVIAIRLADPWTWAALVGPVVMFAVLMVGTGVPPLEEAMLRSKGEAYRRYQAKVSLFFPRPPKEIAP
jgi:steroid 5-alpha reductase family enzyme